MGKCTTENCEYSYGLINTQSIPAARAPVFQWGYLRIRHRIQGRPHFFCGSQKGLGVRFALSHMIAATMMEKIRLGSICCSSGKIVSEGLPVAIEMGMFAEWAS